MLTIEPEKFRAVYPIKFVAPFSIDECRNRLQLSLGKPMGDIFTNIEGKVVMLDESTCNFTLYQRVSKGANPIIIGDLHRESENKTLVDAVFTRQTRPLWEFGIIVLMIIAMLFIIQQVVLGILCTLLWAIILYIVWRNKSLPLQSPRIIKKEPMSQLLWWFERTLKN